MQDILIGTAGHIDHGKTTLVKALTGIDADRLQEEKARKITIDIGFAHMQLGPFRVGFIDVPGHERFVKNMLAGIGGIELVLLVIAADESTMPQTLEHFQICRLLEIKSGIVVLTKRSLVDEELLQLVEEEIKEFVQDSFLEGCPIQAVDSLTGQGLDDLRVVLEEEVARLQAESSRGRADRKLFRMPIDRVFTQRGFGTIVTGTPYTGTVQREKALQILPGGQVAKVREIQVFGKSQEEGRSGQRTALNLSGVERDDLVRGMVLAPPDRFQPSHMLDTRLTLLSEAPRGLRNRTPIRFHHGSAEIVGRAYLLSGKTLEPGARGLVQLRLDQPCVCCAGDRFILRSYSPMRTIGGGMILDPKPNKHTRNRKPEALDALFNQLEADSGADLEALVLRYLIQATGVSGITLKSLISKTGLPEEAVRRMLESQDDLLLIEQERTLAMEREKFKRVGDDLIRFLEAFHKKNPLQKGVPKEELKGQILPHGSSGHFQYLLEDLRKSDRVGIEGSLVSLQGSSVQLNEEQEKVKAALLKTIERFNLQPPSQKELIESTSFGANKAWEVLHFLLESGQLIRITGELLLTRRQVDEMKDKLRKKFPPGSSFSVAEFKILFGLTRKHAIPFLEFLDREGVTKRTGTKRLTR